MCKSVCLLLRFFLKRILLSFPCRRESRAYRFCLSLDSRLRGNDERFFWGKPQCHNKSNFNLILSICLLIVSQFIAAPVYADIKVTDYAGNTVQISQPAKRIVALAPHIVENTFSAGAGDLLVGVVSYSDYPEAAKAIKRVGSIQAFSLEAVLARKPDLVVAWSSSLSPAVLQKFRDLNITVYLDEPRKLEDVARSIRAIGVLTGRSETSERAALNYLTKLETFKHEYAQHTPVSLFYPIWNEPLQTVNGQHIISDVMRLCGGENIFADAAAIAPKVSVETVLARNPEVIIASGMGDVRPDWLDDWKQWPMIKAVKNNHLFFIHPDLLQRHTVRLLEGADILCHQLEKVRLDLRFQ